jgi:hypothetical protein
MLLLLCVLSTGALAQEDTVGLPSPDTAAAKAGPRSVVFDSSGLDVRRPSEARLEEYRGDGDFVYDRVQPTESLWDAFKTWFWSKLRKLFGTAAGEGFLRALPYVLFGAALIFLIWKLIGANFGGTFYRNKAEVSEFGEIPENIHEMDFDALVAEAVRGRNFRRAVRLLYLNALKQLTDSGRIDWRKDKTNHDYLYELAGSDLRSPFERATILFDYVWYGGFQVDEPTFEHVKETFQEVGNKLARAR